MNRRKAIVMPFPLRPHQMPEAQFSDYFEMGFEPYLFKIYFGQHDGGPEDASLKVGLVMSPAVAKALATHLEAQIVSYEMEFGEIRDVNAPVRGAAAGD